MDITRPRVIYPSVEAAVRDGVRSGNLVTGSLEALQKLQRKLLFAQTRRRSTKKLRRQIEKLQKRRGYR